MSHPVPSTSHLSAISPGEDVQLIQMLVAAPEIDELLRVFLSKFRECSDDNNAFISYAWPRIKKPSDGGGLETPAEAQVQTRLKKLVKRLEALGVKVLLDLNNLKGGMQVEDYMHKGIDSSDSILLIVIPSSLKNYEMSQQAISENRKPSNFFFELAAIKQRLKQQDLKVFPLMMVEVEDASPLLNYFEDGDNNKMFNFVDDSLMGELAATLQLAAQFVSEGLRTTFVEESKSFLASECQLVMQRLESNSSVMEKWNAMKLEETARIEAEQAEIQEQLRRLCALYPEYQVFPRFFELPYKLDENELIATQSTDRCMKEMEETLNAVNSTGVQISWIVGEEGSGRKTMVSQFFKKFGWKLGLVWNLRSDRSLEAEIERMQQRLRSDDDADYKTLDSYLVQHSPWAIVLDESHFVDIGNKAGNAKGGWYVVTARPANTLVDLNVVEIPEMPESECLRCIESCLGTTSHVDRLVAQQVLKLVPKYASTMAQLIAGIQKTDCSWKQILERIQSMDPKMQSKPGAIGMIFSNKEEKEEEEEEDSYSNQRYEHEFAIATEWLQQKQSIKVANKYLDKVKTLIEGSTCFWVCGPPTSASEMDAVYRMLQLSDDLETIGIRCFFPLVHCEASCTLADQLTAACENTNHVILAGTASLSESLAYSVMMSTKNKKSLDIIPIRFDGGFMQAFPSWVVSQLIEDCSSTRAYYENLPRFVESICKEGSQKQLDLEGEGYRESLKTALSVGLHKEDRENTKILYAEALGHHREQRYRFGLLQYRQLNSSTADQHQLATLHNMPERNKSFSGRNAELKALIEALSSQWNTGKSNSSLTIMVEGGGGVGKSGLAIEGAYCLSGMYWMIGFVVAESAGSLMQGYKKLAQELNLISASNNLIEADIVTILHGHLECHPGALLIFDNAEDPKLLKRFLPNKKGGGTDVIVTSRSSMGWNRSEFAAVITLREMGLEEARALLFKAAELDNVEEDVISDANGIVSDLGCLPLAVFQIGRFLAANPAVSLKEYRKSLGAQGSVQDDAISMTWEITLRRIEQMGSDGKVAKLISEYISILAPDDIAESYLRAVLSLTDTDAQQLQSALAILNRYGLITRKKEEETFSVHRVTRSALLKRLVVSQQDRLRILDNWMTALTTAAELRYNPDVFSTFRMMDQLSIHTMEILKFSVGNPVPSLKKKKVQILTSLSDWAFHTHQDKKLALDLCQQALEITTDLPRKCEILARCSRLATAVSNYAEALRYWKEAEALSQDQADFNIAAGEYHLSLQEYELGLAFFKEARRRMTASNKLREYEAIWGTIQCLYRLDRKFNAQSLLEELHSNYHDLLFGRAGSPRMIPVLQLYETTLDSDAPKMVAIQKQRKTLMRRYLGELSRDMGVQTPRYQILRSVVMNDLAGLRNLLVNRESVNYQDDTGCSVLYLAAERGAVKIVDYLIEVCSERNWKLNVNEPTSAGESPVHIASFLGFADIVERLLLLKANTNQRTHDTGSTALLMAIQTGQSDIVQLLLKNSEVSVRDFAGNTVVHWAIKSEKMKAKQIVALLELALQFDHINTVNKKGETFAILAAGTGQLDVLEELISRNADLLLQSYEGKTTVHVASENGHLQAVKLLYREGVSLRAQDGIGRTALYFASRNGHTHIVKYLLEHGCGDAEMIEAAQKSGATCLYAACENGHLDILELLISHKANTNVCLHTGVSSMFGAATNGHLEVIKRLHAEGVSCRTFHSDGRTALWQGSYFGHFSCVQFLLENECDQDIEKSEKAGATPLFVSCQEGHSDLVQLLISFKANIHACLYDGKSILCAAAESGLLHIVEQLHNAGVSLRSVDTEGRTCLWSVCDAGRVKVAQYLLDHGCEEDLEVLEEAGSSPLFIASAQGNLDVVELLISRKAKVDVYDSEGGSVMWFVVEKGHFDVMKKLHGCGVPLKSYNSDGQTTLWAACGNGHAEIAEYLINNGCADGDDDDDSATSSPLLAAAAEGYGSIVGLLIAHDANVNAIDDTGTSALYMAAQNGHYDIVKMLHEVGASLRERDEDGLSPLFAACVGGHARIVQYLLDHGCEEDVETLHSTGATPLVAAANGGHLEIVNTLLSHGAKDPDKLACFSAIQNGHFDVVKKLHEFGIEPKCKNAEGQTGLWAGSQNGHIHIVAYLLEHGCEDELEISGDALGSTPLFAASEKGHLSVVDLLISHKANVNVCRRDGVTALYMGCLNGHLEIVKRLHDSGGVNLRSRDIEGHTPLLGASLNGHVRIVQYLLDHGCDEDIEFSHLKGATPLYAAAQNGHLSVIEILIQYGASVHARLYDQKSALYVAAQNGHFEIVRKLHEFGMSVRYRDDLDRTALYGACLNGHTRIVEYLLENGCEEDMLHAHKGNASATPLFVAHEKKHGPALKLLLSRKSVVVLQAAIISNLFDVVESLHASGADMNAPNTNGRTPLWIAAYRGCYQISQYLLQDCKAREVINKVDNFGCSPLAAAASTGDNEDTIHLLLKNNANLLDARCIWNTCLHGDTTLVRYIDNQYDSFVNQCVDGKSMLWAACYGGNPQIVDLMMENGHWDVQQLGCSLMVTIMRMQLFGLTRLLAMTKKQGHFEGMCLEWSKNVDELCYVAAQGILPVFSTMEVRNSFMLPELKDFSAINVVARCEDATKRTALWWSVASDITAGVKWVLDNIGDKEEEKRDLILKEDETGWNALRIASSRENRDIFDLLMQSVGDSMDVRGHEAETAALYGQSDKFKRLVGSNSEQLVERCCDLAASFGHVAVLQVIESEKRMAIRQIASRFDILWVIRGNVQIFQWLEQDHDSIELVLQHVKNAKGERGRSVLHLACENGHLGLVKWLVKQMPPEMLVQVDADGKSALWFAVDGNYHMLTTYLVGHGGFSSIIDRAPTKTPGLTPLCVAIWHGNTTIARLLMKYGAKPSLCSIEDLGAYEICDVISGDRLKGILQYYFVQNREEKKEQEEKKEEKKEEILPPPKKIVMTTCCIVA